MVLYLLYVKILPQDNAPRVREALLAFQAIVETHYPENEPVSAPTRTQLALNLKDAEYCLDLSHKQNIAIT